MVNANNSPIFDMIRVSDLFGLYNEVKRMLLNNHFYSKGQWKNIVWNRAWGIERQDWAIRASLFRSTKTINTISDPGRLLIWWQLAGIAPEKMRQCETMVRLICHASLLKADDCSLKRATFGARMCILCDDVAYENTRHMVTHCRYHNETRIIMLNSISEIAIIDCQKVLGVLMGAYIKGFTYEEMVPVWKLACSERGAQHP